MNLKIIMMNLIVPILAVLVIGAITGGFRAKKKESIKSEVYEYFVKIWKADEKEDEKDSSRDFFTMFLQTYEYEKYKESSNKFKYYIYKLLVLLVILSIPFLALVLITSKEWLLNDAEWNNIYLYTVILVPLLFAYLINQYCRIKQYRETCIAIVNLPPRAMMGIDSCGMLISAVHHEEGAEKLHLLQVDSHIPASAKLY